MRLKGSVVIILDRGGVFITSEAILMASGLERLENLGFAFQAEVGSKQL